MLRKNYYLGLSVIAHVAVLLVFILSFNWHSPLQVVENSNKQDIISAVVLGETPDSKILPDKNPQPMSKLTQLAAQRPAKKMNPTPSVKEVIPLKKLVAKKKKYKADPMFAKDLLADIQKQVDKKKLVKQKPVKSNFEKTLQAQAEKTLRQHLLDEDILLKAKEARAAQGEVNKYQALITQAIGENWIVPVGADKSLVCELMIRVAENGSVVDVQVTKTSGDISLDRSARAAVLKASPLPVPKNHAAFAAFKQFVLKVKPENVIPGDSSFGPG